MEFVLAGLGPVYRPFARLLESRHEDITFDVLYGMLLNEDKLQCEVSSTVIAPQSTQKVQSAFPGVWHEFVEFFLRFTKDVRTL